MPPLEIATSLPQDLGGLSNRGTAHNGPALGRAMSAAQPGQKPRAFLRRAGFLLVLSGSGAGLGYVTSALLARYMGATEYGVYALILTWVTAATVVPRSGIGAVSLRYGAEYLQLGRRGHFRGLVHFGALSVTGCSIILAGLFVALRGVLFPRFASGLTSAVLIGAVAIPVLALVQLNRNVLIALRQQVRSLLAEQTVENLAMIALVGAWLVASRRIQALQAIAFATIAGGAALLASAFFLRGTLPEGFGQVRRSYDWRVWIRTGLPLFVVGITQFILGRGDILVLGALAPTLEVGIYAAAVVIATPMQLFMSAANAVVSPEFAAYFAAGRIDLLQQLLTRTVRALLVLATPVALGLILGGRDILGLLGGQYPRGYLALVFLVLAEVISLFSGCVGYVLQMTGEQDAFARLMVCLAVVTMALYLVMIPRFGAAGAGAATLISFVLRSILMSRMVAKRVGVTAMPFGIRRGGTHRRRNFAYRALSSWTQTRHARR